MCQLSPWVRQVLRVGAWQAGISLSSCIGGSSSNMAAGSAKGVHCLITDRLEDLQQEVIAIVLTRLEDVKALVMHVASSGKGLRCCQEAKRCATNA